MTSELHLRVVTPDRTVLDRKVRSVQFMGVDGSYGILPRHAPLLTATMPGIVTIKHTDGTQENMLVTEGFAEMRDNVLSLICEAGERATEIDEARAREAEARAREAIAGTHTVDINLAQAEAALQRALLRQMLARRQAGTGRVQ
jgi:F-type H+-transporting ATPase subunit epsilon